MVESVFYRANDKQRTDHKGKLIPWKPSIHMKREDSRILLEVVDVRWERVQKISEGDAKSEGIVCLGNPVIAFSYLWNSINEKRGLGWEVNPWVWVVEFKRLEP